MRIAVVGPQRPDLFADNIVDSLNRMGHEVIAFGSAFPQPRGNLSAVAFDLVRKATPVDLRFQRRVIDAADESRPDVLLTVESLSPEIIEALRSRGIRTAFWFPDAVSNLGRTLMFAAPYHALFFKQRSLVSRARDIAGVPAHHLAEACNPSWHTPPPGIEPEPVVVVAAAMYPYRVRILERLVAAKIPLRIFGPPPPRWLRTTSLEPFFQRSYLARWDKAREFRRGAVVLNTLHPAEIEGYNARLFEATGCGAATLTEARPELSEFFEEDEVLTFVNFDELVDRCRWAISDLDAARSVGDRATERAHADHTYDQRLEALLEIVTK